MRRLSFIFLVLLAAGSYLWPWLRELGLARLPGDLAAEVMGYSLHLPITTSLLVSGVIATVWWLLEPR